MKLKWRACRFVILLAVSIVYAGNAYALEACKDMDLRNAQPGVKCITAKRAIFERVVRDNFGEAWKGPDGLIWSDLAGNDVHARAEETCKNIGGALPKNKSFERAESYGFREVLPNMKTQDKWWTGSVYPNLSGTQYVFKISRYYDVGMIGGDDFTNSNFIRCVGR